MTSPSESTELEQQLMEHGAYPQDERMAESLVGALSTLLAQEYSRGYVEGYAVAGKEQAVEELNRPNPLWEAIQEEGQEDGE